MSGFTPAVTAGTGLFTTVTGAGRFKRIGKMVYIRIQVSVGAAGIGTAASYVQVTLPASAPSANIGANLGQAITGLDTVVGGKTVTGHIPNNSTVMTITNTDATFPAANSSNIIVSGWYEAA
jgi:hypothetical protein